MLCSIWASSAPDANCAAELDAFELSAMASEPESDEANEEGGFEGSIEAVSRRRLGAGASNLPEVASSTEES